jgi:hypothetical protein
MSSTPPPVIKISGSRSPTPDIPVIKIESDDMDTPPVAPSETRILDRSRGSRSNREIYFEEEVTRLTSKRLEYKKKSHALKKELNEAIIEKEIAVRGMAMTQKRNEAELQALRQQNQALRNQGKHDFLVYCVL